jgi:hypothetical protein
MMLHAPIRILLVLCRWRAWWACTRTGSNASQQDKRVDLPHVAGAAGPATVIDCMHRLKWW